METLVIHLDNKASKTKVKEVLTMIKGVKNVSDKISKADFENLADDFLVNEMKKAEKDKLYGYDESKKRFVELRNKLTK